MLGTFNRYLVSTFLWGYNYVYPSNGLNKSNLCCIQTLFIYFIQHSCLSSLYESCFRPYIAYSNFCFITNFFTNISFYYCINCIMCFFIYIPRLSYIVKSYSLRQTLQLLYSGRKSLGVFGSPYINQALVVSGGESVIRQRGERGNDHIAEGEKVKNISLE
jgi:hypothetical protein